MALAARSGDVIQKMIQNDVWRRSIDVLTRMIIKMYHDKLQGQCERGEQIKNE